jgi:hypothetical protein
MAKYFLDYEIIKHERTMAGDFEDTTETAYIAGVYADNGSYGIDLAQQEFDDIDEAKQWAKDTIKVCKKRGMDYVREAYGVNI